MNFFWVILIVFIIFLALFTIFLFKYKKDYNLAIFNEEADISIFYKYLKNKNKKLYITKKILKIAANIIFAAIFVIVIIFFILNYLNITPYKILVVATDSMSYKNEENTYLFNNDLNNQFSSNDIVIVKRVNDITDLKLYDIISYTNNKGINIIHRIIDINDEFIVTRGDANNISDDVITFNQVIGVYNNFRIPKLGLIVFYLQSYYGILCVFAIYYLLIMYSYVSNRIKKEEENRLIAIKAMVNSLNKYTLIGKQGKIEVENNNFCLIKEKNPNIKTHIGGIE